VVSEELQANRMPDQRKRIAKKASTDVSSNNKRFVINYESFN
jgi:hypothetical protein